MLVDDGGFKRVSTAGYIGLSRKGDVRDMVDADMFTRELEAFECSAGAESFPPA